MSVKADGGIVASIPRSVATLLASRVGAQVLGVVLTVMLAARLGVTGFGEYAVVGAIVFVANVVTTFGTDMILIRDIARDRRFERCAVALVLQAMLSLAAMVCIWSAPALVPGAGGDIATALRVMSLSLLPAALFSVCTAVLRGDRRMHAYAVVSLTAAAAPVVAVGVLVPTGAGVVRAAIALLAAQAVATLVAGAACAARVPPMSLVSGVGRSELVAMARISTPVGILGILGILYQRCSAIAIALIAGPVATSWFVAASRITEASKTGHVALFTALYPAMAEVHAVPRRRRGLDRSLRFSVLFAAVITATLLLAGPALVDRLYGAAFTPARTGVMVLAIAVLPSTVATYQSLALLAADRARDTLPALALSLVILLAATAVLVPAFGWVGACWATLFADTANASMLSAAVRSAAATRPSANAAAPAASQLHGEAA